MSMRLLLLCCIFTTVLSRNMMRQRVVPFTQRVEPFTQRVITAGQGFIVWQTPKLITYFNRLETTHEEEQKKDNSTDQAMPNTKNPFHPPTSPTCCMQLPPPNNNEPNPSIIEVMITKLFEFVG